MTSGEVPDQGGAAAWNRPEDPAVPGVPAGALEDVRRRMLDLVRRTGPRWIAPHAEDIVQSAIARVFERGAPRGGEPGVSASYYMKAAYHATVDEIRRRYRSREMSPPDDTMLDRALSSRPDPESAAQALEIDRGIRACLNDLAAARRRAVTLYLLGYSLGETASALGGTPKRSEHRIYRGLEDMRRCLSGKGIEP